MILKMTVSCIYLQETAARDGLMKMKTVYEANPALGDPMSIQVNILLVIEVKDSSRVLYQGQLTENGHRLDKLRSDLRRYQVRLENSCMWNGERPIDFDPGMARGS